MPSEKYMRLYKNYWPITSQKIYDLLEAHIDKKESVLEVGFASGHILANLSLTGYNVTGIEIRKEVYQKTKNKCEKEIDARLICGDIFNLSEKFDVIYSTGLLQCFDTHERKALIEHLSQLTNRLIIVVPEIISKRNEISNEKVGVAGCCEYTTQNLMYELFEFYSEIYGGKWNAAELEISDSFLYFRCRNRGSSNER